LSWTHVYFILPTEYVVKKPPVPTKRIAISLIKIKSNNAFFPFAAVMYSLLSVYKVCCTWQQKEKYGVKLTSLNCCNCYTFR